MALSVIGAGMPRTGTLSLKKALERLGFGPCHHMTEVFADPASWPLWDRVADGEAVDWGEVFAGWRATTDAPGCWFYRELAERYPDAKLILTERDPDRWFDSMAATIFSAEHRQTMQASPVGQIIRKLSTRKMPAAAPVAGSWAPPGREVMTAMFRAHSAAVCAAIPPERLLIYRVTEGWGPLCAFLGVGVPNEPFPQVNNPDEFRTVQIPA